MAMRRYLDVAHPSLVAEAKAEKCAKVHVWEVEGEDVRPSHASHGFLHVLVFALSVSNILFAGLCLFLYLDAQCPISHSSWPSSTPSEYLSSDFPSARSAIQYEAREFAGFAGDRIARKEARQVDKSAAIPETGTAWTGFDQDTIFALTDGEAMPFLRDGLFKDPSTNHYYGELSVFHSLKCLNVVRTQLNANQHRLNGDSVQEELALPQNKSSAYLDYCLEQLRQTIQCSADLTLVPMVKEGSNGKEVSVAARQKHTCRNWESVKNWVDGRNVVGKEN